jgi:hypothetical protein
MSIFDNPWYAEIIKRFTRDTSSDPTNTSIDGLGRSLLVAACIIAQAIDAHTEAIKALARTRDDYELGGEA